MKFQKLFALLTLTAMMVAVPALAETYGSGTVADGQTYTIEQMLTYALQDEYMASAEYQALISTFGSQPFENILGAESTHVSELLPLFEAYGVTAPENDAASRVAVPETVGEACAAGVEAEKSDIAMYEAFLGQELPDDVKQVFEQLKNASENHLAAFERNTDRQTASPRRSAGLAPGRVGADTDGTSGATGNGAGNGAGTGANRGGSGNGKGNGAGGGNGRGGRNAG